MRYRVTHHTRYRYDQPVEHAQNLLHLTPRAMPRQRVLSHQLEITPQPADLHPHTDYFGNRVTGFALARPHREMLVTARSEVEVRPGDPPLLDLSPPWETVRDDLAEPEHAYADDDLAAYQYAFDSPLAGGMADDLHPLRAYAHDVFEPGRPVLAAADALCRRLFDEFTYDPAATTISTPLAQVMADRRGVCQDFAHLMIGMLRGLGLPARYVSGYIRTFKSIPTADKPDPPDTDDDRLVGADASHAWLALYCPGQGWVDFDPTNGLIPTDMHITVAWGRDYSDVSPVRGVVLGGGESDITVAVAVEPLGDADDPAP